MTNQEIYDEILENTVTKLETLQYFVKETKKALASEDERILDLAESMIDRAESLYREVLELRRAHNDLENEGNQ